MKRIVKSFGEFIVVLFAAMRRKSLTVVTDESGETGFVENDSVKFVEKKSEGTVRELQAKDAKPDEWTEAIKEFGGGKAFQTYMKRGEEIDRSK